MHIFLDNFHQGGTYTAQIASHQSELRTEEKFTDQQYLFITSLQTDYLNLDSSSGSGRSNERENSVHTKCTFCGGANHPAEKWFKRIIKYKEKYREAGNLDRQHTEHIPRICFICGSADHLIDKCTKPSKDN